MKRSASAVWKGGLKDGKGTVSSESGAVSNVPYSFARRFENEKGTNPEELIAAAHAACFSMALSLFIANEGLTPDSVETKCDVSFEKVGDAWTITESHLTTTITAAGDKATIMKAAEGAKAGCPISRLLNTKITLDARTV